ncbi:hypothetical protein HKX42_10175 [Salinisphaera sp. USBA-960]|nr:hypothetical protein [Salifodinibacter halophilus]NNC27240.1 hypothetical protein [Salifodinibacter halophilus]
MFKHLITSFRTPQLDPSLIEAHYAFLDGLREKRQLEPARPFTDKSGGVDLIQTKNMEEAKAIAFSDSVHTSIKTPGVSKRMCQLSSQHPAVA